MLEPQHRLLVTTTAKTRRRTPTAKAKDYHTSRLEEDACRCLPPSAKGVALHSAIDIVVIVFLPPPISRGGIRKAIGLGAMTITKDLQSTTVAFEIRKHGQEEG
jgi:hypothetical protein